MPMLAQLRLLDNAQGPYIGLIPFKYALPPRLFLLPSSLASSPPKLSSILTTPLVNASSPASQSRSLHPPSTTTVSKLVFVHPFSCHPSVFTSPPQPSPLNPSKHPTTSSTASQALPAYFSQPSTHPTSSLPTHRPTTNHVHLPSRPRPLAIRHLPHPHRHSRRTQSLPRPNRQKPPLPQPSPRQDRTES